MSVAQGAVWSDTIGPIIDSGGAVVSNAVSAGHLTITALYDSAGSDQKSGASLTYLGNGVYQVSKTISGNAALGNWTLVVTWDNTVEPARTYTGSFEVVTAQQKDPMASSRAAKLDTIGAGSMIVQSAIDMTGDATIIQGDDYRNAAGRALTWTSASWPVLTSGSAVFTIYALLTGTSVKTKSMTVVNASTVRVDLTATETAALAVGGYRFTIVATLADASIVTLVDAGVTVRTAGR